MRLINADKLKKDGWYLSRNYQQDLHTNVYETKKISDVPTIDAVPVVRCIDCKYSSFDHYTDGNMSIWDCLYWDKLTDEDAYCSYGEKER